MHELSQSKGGTRAWHVAQELQHTVNFHCSQDPVKSSGGWFGARAAKMAPAVSHWSIGELQ